MINLTPDAKFWPKLKGQIHNSFLRMQPDVLLSHRQRFICFLFLCAFVAVFRTPVTHAATKIRTVILHRFEEKIRQEYVYPEELLRSALEASAFEFGDVTLNVAEQAKTRNRALRDIIRGKYLHIMVSPPSPEWDKNTIRVQFPIARGLLSYRIYLLLEKNKKILNQALSLEDLKALPTGSGSQWSITKIFRQNDFNVIPGVGGDSLINMLKSGRFVTFSRGLNEVFTEYEILKREVPDLEIDDNYLLYVYMPTYFYVSAEHPELAERILKGLKAIHQNGTMDEMFNRHHGELIEKAQLYHRRIFEIENPYVTVEEYEQDRPYILRLPGFRPTPSDNPGY